MSLSIARAAIHLPWQIRLYNLLSLAGGLQVYSMCGSGERPFSPFTTLRGLWVSQACVLMHVSLRDDSRRELIPQGQTGGLMIFEDHPNYWDAWGASYGTYTSQRGFVINGELWGGQTSRYIILRRRSILSLRMLRSSSLVP
jgi:hypothetical protein